MGSVRSLSLYDSTSTCSRWELLPKKLHTSSCDGCHTCTVSLDGDPKGSNGGVL
ncbi:hypothetical protein SEA_REDBEAR_2 [Streptomyces phage RedBear]|nr:hypothetical protein SEA_REDBEAR_2 [Streptomyces phage RedBear]